MEEMEENMKHFGTLYWYEWKKLLGKRIVRISTGLVFLILIFAVFSPLFGNYYIDGKYMGTNYEVTQTDRAYAEALSGREIDRRLIEETITAYRKIPQNLDIHYVATNEYQKYARPYSVIFNFLRKMSGMQTSELMYSWEPDADDLSAKRRAYLLSYWNELRLTAGEIDFWSRREAQIPTPYLFEEYGGYHVMFSSYQAVGYFLLILIAICLSGSLRMNTPERPIRSFCAALWERQSSTPQSWRWESAFPHSQRYCSSLSYSCQLSAYMD